MLPCVPGKNVAVVPPASPVKTASGAPGYRAMFGFHTTLNGLKGYTLGDARFFAPGQPFPLRMHLGYRGFPVFVVGKVTVGVFTDRGGVSDQVKNGVEPRRES